MCQNGMQSEWEIHAWHSSVRGVCEYNNSNVILKKDFNLLKK